MPRGARLRRLLFGGGLGNIEVGVHGVSDVEYTLVMAMQRPGQAAQVMEKARSYVLRQLAQVARDGVVLVDEWRLVEALTPAVRQFKWRAAAVVRINAPANEAMPFEGIHHRHQCGWLNHHGATQVFD